MDTSRNADKKNAILEKIRQYDKIVIARHERPDGDAIGSASALCLALRSLGEKAYVMINEPVPKNLDFLECGCTTTDDSVLDDVQLSLMLDCNGMNRISGREKAWERGRLKGCIDHHSTKAKEIRYDFSRIEPKSAATGEIVYNVIKAMGCEITLDIVVTGTFIAALPDGEWLEIRYSLPDQKDPRYEQSEESFYDHIAGNQYPNVIVSGYRENKMTFSALFLAEQEEERKRFESLLGKAVILKLRDGSAFTAILDNWSKEIRKKHWTAYSFSLRRIEWEDYIDDTE